MGKLELTLQPTELGRDPWYQLVLAGPCIEVTVELHPSEVQQRRQEGRAVPQPVAVQALIDTGASVSVVDESLLKLLDPIVSNTIKLKGIRDDVAREVPILGARFSFPGSTLGPWDGQVAADQVWGKTAQQRILLGRDFLVKRKFSYDGPGGRIVITD